MSDKNFELEEKLLAEQGDYEIEFLCGAENDLPKRMGMCKKNPTHEGFISIEDFGPQHLPEYFRGTEMANCIHARADLTVRVVANYTSSQRPQGYSNHSLAGKHGTKRCGTGWISEVNELTYKTCPCSECSKSAQPKGVWGGVMVRTALHVIFDDEEAQNATFDLFYDSGEKRPNPESQKLVGSSLWDRNMDGDFCLVMCATHDLELTKKLKNMADHYCHLYMNLSNLLSDKNQCFAGIVSHPHGCSKQVSVGEWRESWKRKGEGKRYTYTTCTCPGSSGAHLLIFDKRFIFPGFCNPHSRRTSVEGINMCGGTRHNLLPFESDETVTPSSSTYI